MKHKRRIFFQKNVFPFLILFLLSFFLVLLTYFIIANTFLSDKTIYNLKVGETEIGLKNSSELYEILSKEYIPKMPAVLKFSFNGKTFDIRTSELNLTIDSEKILKYGKGSNFFKVIQEGLSSLLGHSIPISYNFEIDKFIDRLPFKISNDSSVEIVDNEIKNCETNTFNVVLDEKIIKNEINNGIIFGSLITIDPNTFFIQDKTNLLPIYCNTFNLKYPLIKEAFEKLYEKEISSKIKYVLKENNPTLIIKESDLTEVLSEIKKNLDSELKEGSYSTVENKVYLYEPFLVGKEVNIENSYKNITAWLNNPTNELPLEITLKNPKVLSLDKEIVDFTSEYSSGQSRINLFFGIYANPYIENSRVGLQEIEGLVIQPGEEFSFYNTISPRFEGVWRTKNGRLIDSGICNSTTTLFRTALESGMQITERYYHSWAVPKYLWPYEVNLVDAAYLTSPKADFKFINTLGYPILLRTEFWRDAEYEYQKVRIFTNPKAKKREVKLSDFRVWDVKIPNSIYKGSFKRTVKEEGVVIREDEWYSDYRLVYGTF